MCEHKYGELDLLWGSDYCVFSRAVVSIGQKPFDMLLCRMKSRGNTGYGDRWMRRCRNFTLRMWWARGVTHGDMVLRTWAFLPPRPFVIACTGRVGAHCAPKRRTCLPYSLIAPPIFSLLGPIHHEFFNPAEIFQPLTDHILFSYPLWLAMG